MVSMIPALRGWAKFNRRSATKNAAMQEKRLRLERSLVLFRTLEDV